MGRDWESSLTGPELVLETTDNVVLTKEKLKAARDHQKSYADKRHKPLEFEVGDRVLLRVSHWKGVVHFGKKGKLALRYIGPFEILERIGLVAYRLILPEELNSVNDTFHVSNLKKCLADANLHDHKRCPIVELKDDRIVDRLSDARNRAGPADSLIPLSHGSFDVIVGIDWLSKRKFVVVCYEKVVRIPLEGDEIFRVHGKRTLGAAKALMNAKVDETRISDIPVEWNSGDDQLNLRWMIYLVVLSRTAESSLEDIMRAYVIEFGGSYHLSIRCAPFEALYGRKCRRKSLESEVGDRVLLKELPWKGVVRFGKKGKLTPIYVGPFEILERIGLVAYRLRLPEELNSVHWTLHSEIMDREIKSLKRSRIPLVKVHWNSKRGPEFTWERRDYMKS
ncbi:hypothetical protein Tco_0787629 [Tanacetum coccineum]